MSRRARTPTTIRAIVTGPMASHLVRSTTRETRNAITNYQTARVAPCSSQSAGGHLHRRKVGNPELEMILPERRGFSQNQLHERAADRHGDAVQHPWGDE